MNYFTGKIIVLKINNGYKFLSILQMKYYNRYVFVYKIINK